jgi:hypothetical protein
MLNDAEVDTIARETLTLVISHLEKWEYPPIDHIISIEGEPVITVTGGSRDGYGSFLLRFVPLEMVKKMVRMCEVIFDSIGIEIFDKDSGKTLVKKLVSQDHVPESRSGTIRLMAECTTVHLLASFRDRLGSAIEDMYEDCELIAKTMLQSVTANALSEDDFGDVAADVRDEIEQNVTNLANKKRAYLRDQIRDLPNVVAERGRGAQKKTQSQRENERKEYEARVQEAYEKLYRQHGKKPKKTWVARELGEGGINPRTGGSSSLQAFRLKLGRLKISYEEVIKSIDEKLNNDFGENSVHKQEK